MILRATSTLIIIITLIFIGLLLAACGGSDSSGPTPTSAEAPTPLKAEFKQPTTIIQEDEEEEVTEEAATSTPGVDLSRGERTYTNRECGACHGAQGEGVADKGGPLAGTELSETEFTDILRTGGQGELGNDHLYGTQAISPSGMEFLYAYIKSFQQ